MPIVEKASIVLGINMSVLLLDGIFAFVGKFIMLSEWELLAPILKWCKIIIKSYIQKNEVC